LYGTITAPGGDIYIDADKGNGAGGSIIRFAVDDSEKARLDSSGRLLVGTSSTSGNITANDKLAVVITGDNTQGGISVTDYAGTGSTTGSNACLRLQRSIGTTDGSFTALTASAWGLGRIEFNGSNGSGFGTGATIEGIADSAAWGSGDHPARLVFSTTADGASSPTERLRINQAGHLLYDYANIREQSSNYSQFGGNTTAYPTLELYAKNSSYASTLQQNIVNRAATNGYYFLDCYSGPGAADFEFRLRGDGQAYADQSWNGGGADYAEYFEWSDGNLGEEDRRGISVVLDGDRIRPAIDGEDPIGVISGNPSVVGDAAWNKWSGKYLRDDYGTYIQEDYEVVNDEGETVIQQRRRLNPAYDPDQEYVNREQRPEWDCVGLMGKLRIRKGQPTGSRWIKMRDISDSVEEWLVR
jgi:hypothetical protein